MSLAYLQPPFSFAFLLISGIALLGLDGLTLQPEVHASVSEDGGRLRCEPAIEIAGDCILVAWNDSWGGAHGSSTGSAVGWAFSSDGGGSFQHGGYLAERDGSFSGADSRIAIDAEGNFHLLVLEWQNRVYALRLFVSPSDAFGTMTERPSPLSREGEMIDKPDFAIAGDGTMLVSYTGPRGIELVRSVDGGGAWSEPILCSSDGTPLRTGCAVRAVGRTVMVAWHEDGADGLTEVWVARSVDGGRTFEPARRIHRLEQALRPPPGYRMAYGQMGHIGTDIGLEPHGEVGASARFDLVTIEGRGAGARLLCLRSTDGGGSWSGPTPVGTGADDVMKVFPSVATIGGRLAVLYYDRRHDAGRETNTDVYLSLRAATGEWKDHRITTVSSKWEDMSGDEEHAPIQRNVGDYIDIAADGRRFACAWTDGRDGSSRIYVRTGSID